MIATLVDPLVDLVLPRHCAGCGRPGSAWCPACGDCLELRRAALAGVPMVAAAAYAGPVRLALLAYKERGRRDLARPLGRALGTAVGLLLSATGLSPADVLLVGVPSTRAAAARRGGDHVLRLAAHASPVCGARVGRGLLTVRRDVLDSAGLTAVERSRNLSGSMRAVRSARELSRPARLRRVVVVDDIVSSGSTVLEAWRALGVAGWPVAGAVAVAATPPAGSGAVVTWHRCFPCLPLAGSRQRV